MRREILPPEPEDDGLDYGNPRDATVRNRVRLFADVPDETRLRIEIDNGTGVWEFLQYLGTDVSEEDIIRLHPRAGRFRVTALDVYGKALDQPRTFAVSASSPILVQAQAAASAGQAPVVTAQGGVSYPVPTSPPGAAFDLTAVIGQIKDLLEAERGPMIMKEAQIAEAQARASEREAAAAALIATATRDQASEMITRQHELSRASLEQTTGAMAQILAMQSQQNDAFMQRMMANIELEKARMAAEIQRQQLDSERERERAKAEAAQAKMDAEQRADREREWLTLQFEREQQRQQEHQRSLEQMRKDADEERSKRNADNNLGGLLGSITALDGLAKKFGVDIRDVGAKIVGGAVGGAVGTGWKDIAVEVLKTVRVAQQAAIPTDDEEGDDEDDAPATLPQPAMLPYYPQQQQAAPQPQQVYVPGYGPQPVQPQPVQPQPQPPMQPQMQPGGMAQPPQIYAPPQAQPVALPPPPPGHGGGDNAARQAVARFVLAIRRAPESDWQAILVNEVVNVGEPLIAYLRRATIAGALAEEGADHALIERVIALVDASGLVDSSIPRR